MAEFDQYADSYDEDLNRSLAISGESKEFFCEGRLQWLAEWLRRNGRRAGRVLDFGCGTGSATEGLLRLPGAESVLGADVSEASIRHARRLHGQGAAEFQTLQNPLPGDLDLAHCNGVFHHIPPDQRQESLKLVFKALKPGGLFALYENNPWNPGTRLVMSRCRFDRDAITLSPPETRRRMRDAGFELLETRHLFFFPSFLAWFRPLESLLSAIPMGAQYVVLGRVPAQTNR